MSGTPDAEVTIDEALIRALLAEQHPDIAPLPLDIWASGWDNIMARLGNDLIVRLPRRQVAVTLIEHEQRYLSVLQPLPIAVPEPVRLGKPGCGYPWPWSIVPWVEGEAADLAPPSSDEAPRFAAFLKALHRPAPANGDAPANPVRGCPLADKTEGLMPRLDQLASETDAITPKILNIWQAALAAPSATEPVWLHGDLHARNVVVHQGQISAIIDWGDICTGDPATDLMSIWALFADRDTRSAALDAYGASSALIARARGWALFMAAILLDTGRVDNARHAKMGRDMFARLAAD
jgi:aminoglycoside phosphotransferase (APT) family kinase protein